MLATWVLIVCSLTTSSAAISALESPRATSRSTSSSRGVSSSSAAGGSGARARRANSSISRRVTVGAKQRAAGGDDADRGDQLLLGRVLEQEAARAGAQRLVDVLVEVEGGEHEHARPAGAARCAASPRRRRARHPDVHEHDVRATLARAGDRLRPVARLADDLDVGLGARIMRKPARTSPWSSASRTRIIAPPAAAGARAARSRPPAARPPRASRRRSRRARASRPGRGRRRWRPAPPGRRRRSPGRARRWRSAT